jgi:hypothetical protein
VVAVIAVKSSHLEERKDGRKDIKEGRKEGRKEVIVMRRKEAM